MRTTLGYSLDEPAEHTNLRPSTIRRVETGKHALSLDVLVPLANARQVSLDVLFEVPTDDDVVIRPVAHSSGTRTTWPLSCPDGRTVAMEMRIEPNDAPSVQRGTSGPRLVPRARGARTAVAGRAADRRRRGGGGGVRDGGPTRDYGPGRPCGVDHGLRPRRTAGARAPGTGPRTRGESGRARPAYPVLHTADFPRVAPVGRSRTAARPRGAEAIPSHTGAPTPTAKTNARQRIQGH
ncbi:helix-turn-helix transcriptional regulator [Streptomyces sp. NPDC005731]|uniref:helix-turn-helix domain-containing protein n=1 Tax=unclassified Streptomyces TaxID=2593676 RepID=UPI0033C99FD3